ncbi:hypothetical protein V9U70_26475 [Streptomyces pratensis]
MNEKQFAQLEVELARTSPQRGRAPMALVRNRSRRRVPILAAHQQLGGPITLIWENLNVDKAANLREFAASKGRLTI